MIKYVLLACALFLVSCATQQQVREIVEGSNAAIIGDTLAPDGDVPEQGSLDGEAWAAQVERIENFIVNHPEMAVTNNALRIRQAVVLLSAKQMALANTVFNQVDAKQLANTRDQAIYTLREHLIWWYGVGRTLSQPAGGCDLAVPTTDNSDCGRALHALESMAQFIDGDERQRKMPRSSSVARFLEQERVRIALRLANMMEGEDFTELLSPAMERYAGQFDVKDRQAIQQWHIGTKLAPEDKAILVSLRFYNYVPSAFKKADTLVDQVCGEQCPNLTPSWVACITTQSCAD